MIRLGNVLKTSFQDVLKMSWRRVQKDLKISWRCLEDVSARRLEESLQTSWQDVLKTSWRRLENVLMTSWRRMAKTNMLVLIKTSSRRLQDVFWKRMTKTNIFVLIKTSWRRVLKRNTKDVFIKTYVCWENISSDMEWRIWITWWIIFCIRYSRLFWIYFKKHETVTDNPSIRIYINKIENRNSFKAGVRYFLSNFYFFTKW